MPDNKPRGRQRNVTGSGSGAFKKGDGLGSGPVGSTGGYSGGSSGSGFSGHSSGGHNRAVKRGGGGLGILLIIVILYFLFGRNGGSSDSSSYYSDDYAYDTGTQNESGFDLSPYGETSDSSSSSSAASSLISQLTSGSYGDSGIYTDSVYGTQADTVSTAGNDADVDSSVSTGARDKRTVIKGGGDDVVTIMVYMCGTDLESKNGMASNDLAEMAQAKLADNVNIIVYTGGCRGWKTSGISSKVNQVYQITSGGMKRLVADDGSKAMTDPNTLSAFIKFCAQNFPANRNELIFWDHGGGSVTGYGYDEKNPYGGSMNLAQIDKALLDGGVKFDFIGFDACLMATAETAVMLDDHADYMIASEETEPGIGWYYTNWLTKLSQNTSMSTLEVGKNIVDDFTNACAYSCRGQKTTLSVVDLAEFTDIVPSALASFCGDVSDKISGSEFKTVSDVRYSTREFSTQSRIDQIDLADFALKMNTSEGEALASAVKSCVKYNRTSSNMTNAYGISIYFPYSKRSFVDQAVSTYQQIGMGDEYLKCIENAAAMTTAGQVSGGSGYDLFSSLAGSGSSGYTFSGGSSDMIGSLLGSFFSARSIPGSDELDRSNTGFYDDKTFTDEEAAEYISLNSFDASSLFWSEGADGDARLSLSSDQWDMIHDIDLNMFIDDGTGYIDLGLDNVFSFDGDDMIADTSGAWLALNGQVMPYYHTDTTESGDDYAITGYAPVLLNGQRARLIIVFDNDNPNGYVAGAVTDYEHEETVPTETVAKSSVGLNVGDTIQFLCDYYTYDFKYDDSYMFGNEITVTEDLTVSDVTIDDVKKIITYRLTDIYDRKYWTPKIEE
ncbi:MAG: peptidase C11 [Lachnospiraceae bacterium]|nr:peptidase C11 [Lachnospiraceae bacterium]